MLSRSGKSRKPLIKRLSWTLIYSCLAAVLLNVSNAATAFALSELPSIGLSAWGSVHSTANINIGSPVQGASTSALSTSNTAGGGTLLSTYTSGNPYSRLSVLSAFNGGKVVEMSEGSNSTHALAAVINRSGAYEVWGWGSNSKSELGLGTGLTDVRFNPTKANWTAGTNEEIIELATGTNFSLMLTRNSISGATKVYGWGYNNVSQLGIGGSTAGTTITSPREITTLSTETIVDISAGPVHSFAVDSSGNVWAWGQDHSTHRPLGFTTTMTVSTDPIEYPIKLDATNAGSNYPQGVLEIESGHYFSVARTASSIYTWGYQVNGGTGRGTNSTTPAQPNTVSLPSCSSPDDIAVGYSTVAVLCAGETSYAWGLNNYRQTGVASATSPILSPTQLPFSGLPAGAVPASIDLSARAGFALLTNGDVWSWGSNYGHMLGQARGTSLSTTQATPAATARLAITGSTAIDIWADQNAAGLIMQNNTTNETELYTWGISTATSPLTGEGSLIGSDATVVSTFDRVGVTPGAYIRKIETTIYSTVVLMSDSSVWTWGYGVSTASTTNTFLGDGSTSRFYPGRITLPFGPDTALPNDTIYDLDCGEYHCLISTSAGKIYGWGEGSSRQLVPSGTADKAYPTQITTGMSSTTQVAAGTNYSLVLDSGAVKAWGTNTDGRAIPGGSASYSTVTSVTGLTSNVVDIDAGSNFSIALKSDGSIRTWGKNTSGQLGVGSVTSQTTLQTPTLPAGVVPVEVKASGQSVICKTASGTWVAWGANNKGVLGFSHATTPISSPTEGQLSAGRRISNIEFRAAASISVEYYSAYAVDTDGNVWSWGSNYLGQSGTNTAKTTTTILNPSQVLKTGGTQISSSTFAVAGSGWGGTWSIPSSATSSELPKPSAPNSPSGSQTDGTITLSWSAPSTTAGLRSYTAILKNSSGVELQRKSVSSTTTSVQFTEADDSIANGTTYKLSVLGVNQHGEGPATSDLSVTPLGVPNPPTSISVSPTSNGVTVAWTASDDDEGSSITSYKVQIFDSSSVQIGASVIVNADSNYSHTFTSGLSAGAAYSAKVIATNGVGDSSPRSSSFIVVGRPSAPLNVSAEPRISGAYVTWDAPSYTGGSAVAAYLVRVYSNNHNAGDTPISTTTVTSSTSATLTGLTDGTDYDVTVLASHDVGLSLLGLESESVDVRPGRPATPTGLSLTPGNQSIAATWTASRSVSGLDPDSYTIQAIPSSGTTVTANVTSASACAGLSCTNSISGLTNGVTYTVSVLASLSGNQSATSSTASATPRTTPGAPTSAALSPGDTSLTLSWEPPTSNGGAEISGYALTVTDADAANVLTVSISAAARSYDIPGLTNGDTYTASLSATNIAGSGQTATDSDVPVGLPSEPESLSIEPRANSLVATWAAPSDTGGTSITSYALEVTSASTGAVTSYSTTSLSECASTSTSTTCTVTTYDDDSDELDSTVTSPTARSTLPANNQFSIKVKAVNAQGESPWTSVETSATTGQPSAPRNVTVSHGNSKFTVCLQEPAFVLSSSISRYQISATDDSGRTFTNEVAVNGFASSSTCPSPKIAYEVSQFDDSSTPVNGTVYSVAVSATLESVGSDAIWGSASSSLSVTPKTTPSSPRNLSASPSSNQAQLSWTAPSSDGGSSLTGYSITYRPINTSDLSTHSPAIGPGSTSATITGLTNGTEYEFFIYALNSEGSSSFQRITLTPAASSSSSSSVSTSKAEQVPPVLPSVLKRNRSAIVKLATSAGLNVLVSSATKSCRVTKIYTTQKTKIGKKSVKRKVHTGWKVIARKKPSCTIYISNDGNSLYNPLNISRVISIK